MTDLDVDKAAQAAAQAAQTAAMQSHYQPPPMQTPSPPVPQQQAQPNITGEQAIEILQKLGLSNLLTQSNLASDSGIISRLNPPPGGGGIPFRDDESVRSSVDLFPHYRNQGVGSIEASNLRPPLPTSFSPFSPDLRMHVDDRKMNQDGLRPNKSFSPAIGGDPSNLPLSGKASPVGSGSGSRTGTGATTPRYGPFFDASANQFFPRSSSRQDSNASTHRDSPTRNLSPGRSEFDGQDPIHDLNGTLASLDLDNNSQSIPTFRKAVGSPTDSTSS
jgi:hypothetical protein